MANGKDKTPLSEKDVVAYLTAHPECLAAHPELVAKCLEAAKASPTTAPNDDSKIVDLSPAIAARARDEARRLGLANKSLLHVASENMVSWKRLHYATLGLLASTDLAGMCHVISAEFPEIFDLQQCRLIIEAETAIAGAVAAGLDVHPAAQTNAALLDRSLFLGVPNKAASSLLTYDAPSVALVRLPDRLPDPVSNCVLLLGGKTENSFQPALGSDLLVLLAEMVGVTLAARLETLVDTR
jgi:uncharacterized protein YigA (DUF484 family)